VVPLSRFTLLRVRDDDCHLLWTSHHLVVDGWSWPLILHEVFVAYNALLRHETIRWEPTTPFRVYVDWLSGESQSASESFWRHYLSGKTSPTRVLGSATAAASATPIAPIGEVHIPVPTSIVSGLNTLVRGMRLTLNTVLLGTWALVVHQLSNDPDVLLGATFSGRPAELDGVEGMVGCFVNNLPVRAIIHCEQNLFEWLQAIGNQLLDIQTHQSTPLACVHSWSEIPSRHRLFDTLFVFQNYELDAKAFRAIDGTALQVLAAPEASRYTLTALVVPQPEFHLRLLFERRHFDDASGAKIVQAWLAVLSQLVLQPDAVVGDLVTVLRSLIPARVQLTVPLHHDSPSELPTVLANEIEGKIVELWQEAFSVERIGLDDNFFDLGGHSVLLVRVHYQLQQTLGRNIPIVKLFQYPTIRSLARFLSQSDGSLDASPSPLARPSRQQIAMVRQRQIWQKGR
jgi:acyl carrier protein